MPKVRILQLPKAGLGLQVKNGKAPTYNTKAMPWPWRVVKTDPATGVNSTLQPVDRQDANIEAEKGEVVQRPGQGGIPETYTVGGKRHFEGGTPLKLPNESFVYSDTKDMRIKDPIILKQFGMPENKSGYTPAQIAKKYNINNFQKILSDNTTTDLQKKTAESMIANYNLKLGKLALVQESQKGFPEGIPYVAMPYLEKMGIDPQSFLQQNTGLPNGQSQGQPVNLPEETQEERYGGNIIAQLKARKQGGPTFDRTLKQVKIVSLPKAQDGKEKKEVPWYDQMLGYIDPTSSNKQQITPEQAKEVLNYMYLGATQTQKPVATSTPVKNTPLNLKSSVNSGLIIGETPKVETPIVTKPKTNTSTKVIEEKVDPYNPDFASQLMSKLESQGLSKREVLPSYLLDEKGNVKPEEFNKSVEDYQGLIEGKKNIYGKHDWSSKDYLPDFYNRQDWYIKEHPKFDPDNPDDVLNFQNEYNKRAESFGLSEYFAPKDSKSKFKVDSRFGQNTYSAPSLNFAKVAQGVAGQDERPKTEADPYKPETKTQPEFQNPADAPWWLQDIIKTAGAAGDFWRVKKYMPWQATPNFVLPEPTFYDPTRELAANAEMANIGADLIGTFTGPQAFNARFNQIQGQGAKSAADVLGKYNNINVGVSNQSSAENASIMNTASANKAASATQLYDKYTIANQQFDNAKNMARQNLRQSYIDAITNRANTQALNSLDDQYQTDPSGGGTIYFTHGLDTTPTTPNTMSYEKKWAQIKHDYSQMDTESVDHATNAFFGYPVGAGSSKESKTAKELARERYLENAQYRGTPTKTP